MSLYENINKRKKAGTSRSKSKSTITKESYANMVSGFKKKKKKPTKLKEVKINAKKIKFLKK